MDNKYYSKKNPNGPYANKARPDGPAPKASDFIEGQSTQKNLDQWADYAHRGSNPTRRST